MEYPTLEFVKSLNKSEKNRILLARYWRFLDSPGAEAIGRGDFNKVLKKQIDIFAEIESKFKKFGGMTSRISKLITWNENNWNKNDELNDLEVKK